MLSSLFFKVSNPFSKYSTQNVRPRLCVPNELNRSLGVSYECPLAYRAIHDGVPIATVVDGEDVVAEALPHLVFSNPMGCASVL